MYNIPYLTNLSSKCLFFCGSSSKLAERSSRLTLTVITLARWSRMEEDAFRYVLLDWVSGNSEKQVHSSIALCQLLTSNCK